MIALFVLVEPFVALGALAFAVGGLGLAVLVKIIKDALP